MTALKLARAVYPQHEWHNGPHDCPFFDNGCNPLAGNQFTGFSPRVNPSQFIDVLVWLNKTLGTDVDFGPESIGIWDESLSRYVTIEHNNIRQQFIDAVVTAAERAV